MDTKSKKFSANTGTKVIAFIICVVFFIGSLVGMGLTYRAIDTSDFSGNIDDILLYGNYKDSVSFQYEFAEKIDEISYILNQYKSEEYIKSGETIREESLEQEIQNLFYESYNNDQSNNMNKYGGEYDISFVKEAFKKDHEVEIAKIKQAMIMDDLRNFEEYQKNLSETEGFTYYATDGTYVVTNLKQISTQGAVTVDLFNKMPAYLIYQDDKLTKVPASAENANSGMRNWDSSLEEQLDSEYNNNFKMYFAFDNKYMTAQEGFFSAAKSDLMKWIPMAIILGLISLITLIYLIVATGRKDQEGNRNIHKIDKIFTEIQLAIVGICLFVGGSGFLRFLFETVNYGIQYDNNIYVNNDPLYISIALASIIGLVSASFGLLFILSCIRKIKAGTFITTSIIYILFKSLFDAIKNIYNGGSLMTKVVLITIAICLLSATIVLAPVLIVLVIIFAPKFVKKYEEIKKGVEEVKSGNLTYKIPLNGEGELDTLAKGINEISQGFDVAVKNELKNQRLKTELISNVSHDIKTPLTSIITYIDLLKTEGLESENAPKYLDVLDQKSIRLKKLTDDLFEAAKASSGAMKMDMEEVDLMSLINQGLGEMSNNIAQSGLEFIINAEKEKYLVMADGQLLWRVVENLLSNVLKYAQENTRVYIDLKHMEKFIKSESLIVMEIKNISKVALNIPEEELMERFTRGDESRSTEGSGLGLSIAKDLVIMQNGTFEIKIDGDLFKAIVALPAKLI